MAGRWRWWIATAKLAPVGVFGFRETYGLLFELSLYKMSVPWLMRAGKYKCRISGYIDFCCLCIPI